MARLEFAPPEMFLWVPKGTWESIVQYSQCGVSQLYYYSLNELLLLAYMLRV